MQKYQRQSLSQRFQQYRASKTALFWSCAGSVVVATIVGFSWGGWVTGGSAQEMAEDAAAQGRQEVAAVVCVDRFMAAPDAGVQLTALQEMTSSYARGRFVQDGGWASMSESSTDNRKAAGLCAEALAERNTSGPGEAAQIDGESTVAQ
jgi:thioesterase domain-containing protein